MQQRKKKDEAAEVKANSEQIEQESRERVGKADKNHGRVRQLRREPRRCHLRDVSQDEGRGEGKGHDYRPFRTTMLVTLQAQ